MVCAVRVGQSDDNIGYYLETFWAYFEGTGCFGWHGWRIIKGIRVIRESEDDRGHGDDCVDGVL